MAYAFEGSGDRDSSLWAINRYSNLAPDEANPYDTRGDLYAYFGRLDRAMESCWNDKAVQHYEIFLDIWKDAGPGIREIEDARRRLAGLKSDA
jgi:hypothetical protein